MKLLHYNSFMLDCVIPFIIFFVCFHQINQHLSTKSIRFRLLLGAYKQQKIYKEKVKLLMKKRKQTIAKLVIMFFLICVIINEVLFMVLHSVTSLTRIQWNSVAYQITVMFRFSNSFVNPFLYTLKSKLFRKRLQKKFTFSLSFCDSAKSY